jgi:hypothetical protein
MNSGEDRRNTAPEPSATGVENEQPPPDEVLEEPSTEKEPGREPKAKDPAEPEPSHQAVGIGVMDGPQEGGPGSGETSHV